jgi:hypothetical protein
MIASFLSPHVAGRTSGLFSQSIQILTTSCISFWYKTAGPIQFNVKKLGSNGVYDSAIFTAQKDRGDEWSLGRGTLQKTGTKVQIVFEAVDQTSIDLRNAEVWLDDIFLDSSKACSPLASCSFEEDLCGFSNSLNSDFDWVKLNGVFGLSQNFWSVPTFDHTLGLANGLFLYLDTNGKMNGQKAIVESEVVSETLGNQCLQFYLKTNQNNKATLRISRKNKVNSVVADLGSLTEASNVDAWFIKEVSFIAQGFPYSYLIQGIVGQNIPGQNGQLAIDDIILLDRSCGSVTPNPISTQSMASTKTQSTPLLTTQSTFKPLSSSATASVITISSNPESCPPDYCLNGGTCVASSNQFKCDCSSGYSGQRCESLTQKNKKSNDAGLIIGVVIAALVVLGLMGGAFYYFKRPKSGSSTISNTPYAEMSNMQSISNPIFDANDDEAESGLGLSINKSKKNLKTYSSVQE